MTFRCNILEEDLAAFFLFFFRTAPATRRMIRRTQSILLLLGLILLLGFAATSGLWTVTVPLFALYMSMVLFWGTGYPRSAAKAGMQFLRNDPIALGEKEYEVNEEVFVERCLAGEVLTRAPFVQAVTETDSHVFVIRSSASGYIIPKRDITPDTLTALRGLRDRVRAQRVAPSVFDVTPSPVRPIVEKALATVAAVAATGWLIFLAFTSHGEGLLEASVVVPSSVTFGETVTMVVAAENQNSRPVTLGSIDIWNSFLEGFQVVSVNPEPEKRYDHHEYRRWGYGIAVEPGASIEIKFELNAVKEGHFAGDIDVCNADYYYNTAVAEIFVTGVAVGPQ